MESETKNKVFMKCLLKQKMPSYVKKDINEEIKFQKEMNPKKAYTEVVKSTSRLFGGYFSDENWDACVKKAKL